MSLFDKRFKQDIFQTATIQILNIASFVVLLVFVLPRAISKEELGLYVIFRAITNAAFPLYTFALDIAQARYLGFHSGKRDHQRQVTMTVVCLFFVLCLVSTAFLIGFRSFLMETLLDNNAGIFWGIVISLPFVGMYRIVYTYYQGHKQMKWANLLQFLLFVAGNTVIAILVLAGYLQRLETIIYWVAFVPAISIIPFFRIMLTNVTGKLRLREVLGYAIPRVPHLFLSGLLLSAAVILAKYFYSAELAGDFGIATRFFQLVATMAYAFNMVLLPGVSELWAHQRLSELRRAMKRYAHLVVLLGTAGVFAFYAWGPWAIRLFLPPQYEPGIPILRVMALGALPYFFYIMFRSIIHGVDERPVQLLVDIFELVALTVVFIVLRFMLPDRPDLIIAASVTAAYVSAGITSFLYIVRRLQFRGKYAYWILHGSAVASLMILSDYMFWIATLLFVLLESGLLVGEWKRREPAV